MAQVARGYGTVEAMHGLAMFVAVAAILGVGLIGFASGYAKAGRTTHLPSGQAAQQGQFALATITPVQPKAPLVQAPVRRAAVAAAAPAPASAEPVEAADAAAIAPPVAVDAIATVPDVAPLPPIANPT